MAFISQIGMGSSSMVCQFPCEHPSHSIDAISIDVFHSSSCMAVTQNNSCCRRAAILGSLNSQWLYSTNKCHLNRFTKESSNLQREMRIKLFFSRYVTDAIWDPPPPKKFRNDWSRKQGIPTHLLAVTYLLDAPLVILLILYLYFEEFRFLQV